MAIDTTVTFKCKCGTEIKAVFTTELFNHQNHGCEGCGNIYSVLRPSISINNNLSRAQMAWLAVRGFTKKI